MGDVTLVCSVGSMKVLIKSFYKGKSCIYLKELLIKTKPETLPLPLWQCVRTDCSLNSAPGSGRMVMFGSPAAGLWCTYCYFCCLARASSYWEYSTNFTCPTLLQLTASPPLIMFLPPQHYFYLFGCHLCLEYILLLLLLYIICYYSFSCVSSLH